MAALRVGPMGFGLVGRQLFLQALRDDRVDVVAISDIGRPEILHHLLAKTTGGGADVTLEGRHLVA